MSEALRKQGNLLESLEGTHKDNNTIEIIRVYPYESHVGGCFLKEDRERIERRNDPEELKILQIFDQIRDKVTEIGWNGNKIVVELEIGYHQVFLGFWDWNISMGHSVVPNPRYQPECRISSSGRIEPVIVRDTPKRPE